MTTQILDALPTPPNPAVDSNDAFALKATAFTLAMVTLGAQMNTLAAQSNSDALNLNALGAMVMPYVFSTTITDADPGAGTLRLSNATQNLSTILRADLLDSGGVDLTTLIDSLDDSTSTIKGTLRIAHRDTPSTKFITFSLMSIASPAGYRNVTVTPLASSSASPFANLDPVVLSFIRNGNAGGATEANVQNQTFTAFTTGGTLTAYTLTPTPAIAAYAVGQSFWINFHAVSGDAPTLNISGLGATVQLVTQAPDGTFTNVGPGAITLNHRSYVTLLSTTQALMVDMPPDAGTAVGQCFLRYTSTTALTLAPCNGNKLLVGGKMLTVNNQTLSNAAAAASTMYFIYAYGVAGVLTLEYSTAVPLAVNASGIRTKTADPSRTLVGMAHTDAGAAWVYSAQKRVVRSWFNDAGVKASSVLAASTGVSFSAWGELAAASTRIEVLHWAGEQVEVLAGACVYDSTGATGLQYLGIGVNNAGLASRAAAVYVDVVGYYFNMTAGHSVELGADGYSYFSYLTGITGGTNPTHLGGYCGMNLSTVRRG